jgi:hypothetical protein
LTAFVLQSVHSYEHLRKATEKQCHHVYQKTKQLLVTNILIGPLFCLEFTFSPNTHSSYSFLILSTGFYCSKSVAVQAQIPNLLEMDCFTYAPPVIA